MHADSSVLSYPQDALPAELLEQVRGLRQRAWPSAPSREPLHDPALDPVSLTLVRGGRVLAALEILSKQIKHGGSTYAASGLSSVVTDAELRGKGYGRRLCVAAREAIVERGADIALFTCDRPLVRFYEAAGFPILRGAVLVGGTPDAPFPSDQWDKVTLAAFLTPHGRAKAASFEHARIELYPGTLDKLW